MSEWEIIARYAANLGEARQDVLCGPGDDAAVCQVPAGQSLVTSMDTLVSGCHFLPQWDPYGIGQYAMAVNLSDLAAMGARPAWALLSLALPEVDSDFLSGLSAGIDQMARAYGVQVVGGDTVSGPLSLSITVMGFADPASVLKRSGANPGDYICVTRALGGPGFALAHYEDAVSQARAVLSVTPEIAAGQCLVGTATACIDLSDGLAGDLGHVCRQSGCGAQIDLGALPLDPALSVLPRSAQWELALCGGGEYGLCFTVPPAAYPGLKDQLESVGSACYHIGCMQAGDPVIRYYTPTGEAYALQKQAYVHFQS
jgi:thiamine-monophosphate kinase